MDLICQKVAATVVMSMGVIQIITIYQGGLFLPFQDTPYYWQWMQSISIFTQGTRSILIAVMEDLSYECVLSSTGQCLGPLGDEFPCDARIPVDGDTTCAVKGRSVLYVLQRVDVNESKWIHFGYLVLIFVVLRLLSLLLLYFPSDRVWLLMTRQWYALLESRTSGKETRKPNLRVAARGSFRLSVLHLKSEVRPFDDISVSGRVGRTPGGISRGSDIDGNAHKVLLESSLTWRRVSATVSSDGKRILDNVSGIARSGRVLAIMGPSGSGKTTLLNVLSNRATYADVSGDIRFCGRAVTISDLVFVPKVVEVNGCLTVQEQIELVGSMRCADTKAMRARSKKMVKALGLEKKLNVPCSKLSVGEIKRLGVCIGMVLDPNVLFLDEPTSGLDSSAAMAIVLQLFQLAKDTSIAVVMTIHQPSATVFNMLHDLYLLEGGRLAFFGPIADAKRFFGALGFHCPENLSAADYYMDLIYTRPTEHANITWKDLYLSFNFSAIMTAKDGVEIIEEESHLPRWRARVYYLLSYFYKYYVRDRNVCLSRLVYLLFMAIYQGTLFYGLTYKTNYITRFGGLIFSDASYITLSVVVCVSSFASDRRLALEYAKNGIVTPFIYCLSQFLVSAPCYFLGSFVVELPVFWLSNISNNVDVYIYASLVCWCLLLVSEAIMLLVVEVLHDALYSVMFALVVVGAVLLLSGFVVTVADIPLWFRWICYLVPTKVSSHSKLVIPYTVESFHLF